MSSRFSKPKNDPSSLNSIPDSSFDSFDHSSSDLFGLPSDSDPFSGSSNNFAQEFGSNSSPAFSTNRSENRSSHSSGSGRGRTPLWIVLAVLATILVLSVILVINFSFGSPKTFEPQLDAGEINAFITVVDNGHYRVQLSRELMELDPTQIYVAGFLMAPEGQDMVAINEPNYIIRTDCFTVTAEIIITRPGNYQLAFYSYPLSNPTPTITRKQMLEIGAATSQTPLPDETIIIAVTPSPSPTPTVTPTPSPSPTPRPHLATEEPLQSIPSSDIFQLYDISTRYYYNQLTDVQKHAFSQMYDGIAGGKTSIPLMPCSREDFHHALNVLQYDCPELFHWNYEADVCAIKRNAQNQVLEFCPNEYTYSVSEYREKLKQVISEIATLSSCPGFDGSDFSRQKALYDYIIHESTYNKDLPFCAYADSVYLYGYSKCTGYATALNLALRFYGIPCAVVCGNTYDNGVLAPEGHMWTISSIDGEWYHCDATWDDHDDDLVHHAYLNLTDKLIWSLRVPDDIHDELRLPDCTSTAVNAIMREGIFLPAGSDIESTIVFHLADTLSGGGGRIQFLFESSADCNTALMLLQDTDVRQKIANTANIGFHFTTYYCIDVNYIDVKISP